MSFGFQISLQSHVYLKYINKDLLVNNELTRTWHRTWYHMFFYQHHKLDV